MAFTALFRVSHLDRVHGNKRSHKTYYPTLHGLYGPDVYAVFQLEPDKEMILGDSRYSRLMIGASQLVAFVRSLNGSSYQFQNA